MPRSDTLATTPGQTPPRGRRRTFLAIPVPRQRPLALARYGTTLPAGPASLGYQQPTGAGGSSGQDPPSRHLAELYALRRRASQRDNRCSAGYNHAAPRPSGGNRHGGVPGNNQHSGPPNYGAIAITSELRCQGTYPDCRTFAELSAHDNSKSQPAAIATATGNHAACRPRQPISPPILTIGVQITTGSRIQ